MPDLPQLKTSAETTLDPLAAARSARLRYVRDTEPGYRRELTKDGFAYVSADGNHVTDEAELARIRKLAVPPAYTDVWICRHPEGHLQAVGRDARGRKQYRYHPRWRAVRDDAKYGKMLIFADKLPTIRQRVAADLDLPGMPRDKVIATIVRLLEGTLARVGNEEYARTNKSFGLTTLRNRHTTVRGTLVTFRFRAKHGIQSHIELRDRKLSRIVARLQDLPGQDLFQYIDEDGGLHKIGSGDVNAYLQEISGAEITAKDFRTWAATNLTALALMELARTGQALGAKKDFVRAVEAVSRMLGNTPAICRKCYIHPAILEGYEDGSLGRAWEEEDTAPASAASGYLSAREKAVVAFLSGNSRHAESITRPRRRSRSAILSRAARD